jgi:hypothetical protein
MNNMNDQHAGIDKLKNLITLELKKPADSNPLYLLSKQRHGGVVSNSIWDKFADVVHGTNSSKLCTSSLKHVFVACKACLQVFAFKPSNGTSTLNMHVCQVINSTLSPNSSWLPAPPLPRRRSDRLGEEGTNPYTRTMYHIILEIRTPYYWSVRLPFRVPAPRRSFVSL